VAGSDEVALTAWPSCRIIGGAMPTPRRRARSTVGAVVALAAAAAAAPGSNGRGLVQTHAGRAYPSQDWAYAVAIQRDGKIVAAGRSVHGKWYFALARYTAAGRLDASFGRGGKVVSFESGSPFGATALELQRDGKLVVAGHGGHSPTDLFAIARYTKGGILDAGFGHAGKVLTRFSSQRGTGAWARALAIQRDGKLVAAGTLSGSVSERFALARYETTGRLDSTFGRDGKVMLKIGGVGFARAVAVQRDGKIVVACGSVLLRFTARGRLDPSFGSGGKVLTGIDSWSVATAVAVEPDGRIVVAGTGSNNFVLLRYARDGRLDPSFGSGGKVVTSFGITKGCGDCDPHDSQDEVLSLARQRDGKIVLAGATDVGGRFGEKGCCLRDFALARYTADGSPDPSFGSDGKVVTAFDRNAYAEDVAIQADGKIVAAGGGAGYFALSRYSSDGRLDPSFGRGGKVRMRFQPG
jgi:uncharacterized delta-60 repeat protein